jgi:uncharacterized protein YndB with AHSA1/START domain
MVSAPPTSETALRLSRSYPAPREEVFRAWTDPKALERWFAPDPEFVTRVPILELCAGGRYRIEMSKGGATHVAVGRYQEVRSPEKLVFTWVWESDPDRGTEDTIVTVEFRDRGRSTEVVLTHERFPNAAVRDDHGKGWTGCLEMLATYLTERSAR